MAHAYTRYLGDLSGGQVIAKQLRRAWAIDGEDGFAFFDFPQVENPTVFKRDYRAALDALPIDAEQAEVIVAEATRAFSYNRALADELWQEIAARQNRATGKANACTSFRCWSVVISRWRDPIATGGIGSRP